MPLDRLNLPEAGKQTETWMHMRAGRIFSKYQGTSDFRQVWEKWSAPRVGKGADYCINVRCKAEAETRDW